MYNQKLTQPTQDDQSSIPTEHDVETAMISCLNRPSRDLPPHKKPPAHATMHANSQAHFIQLQRSHGNAYVSRLIQSQIQRQSPGNQPDAGQQSLPTFDFPFALFFGPKFDGVYRPVGPVPATGELEIQLNVFVELKDFDLTVMKQEPLRSYFRTHPLTKEQRNDFAWPKDEAERKQERQKFGSAFRTQVEKAWSNKHTLHLKDPAFSEYQCTVKVTVNVIDNEADADLAHNRISVQKVPAGVEERFRSFVKGGTSVLDYRDADPTKAQKKKVRPQQLFKQIGPFEHDKHSITPEIQAQLAEVENQLQQMIVPGKTPGGDDFLGEGTTVGIVGRATAPGSAKHNLDLGLLRAETIHDKLGKDLGWGSFATVMSFGEQNASDDERFRRVDIDVSSSNETEVEQVTAAHEAGHMFGLGDEYTDEKPTLKGALPKFEGDEPTHYKDIKNLIDEAAAKETIVKKSGSIMAQGSEVKRGHYVYFLQALNDMSGKHWTVE